MDDENKQRKNVMKVNNMNITNGMEAKKLSMTKIQVKNTKKFTSKI